MDKYDEAIAYLRRQGDDFRNAITAAWWRPHDRPGGALFLFCSPDGLSDGTDGHAGCLTQVKNGENEAADARLTEKIRLDPRVPDNIREAMEDDLETFAAYQREMDVLWPGRYEGKGAPQGETPQG